MKGHRTPSRDNMPMPRLVIDRHAQTVATKCSGRAPDGVGLRLTVPGRYAAMIHHRKSISCCSPRQYIDDTDQSRTAARSCGGDGLTAFLAHDSDN